MKLVASILILVLTLWFVMQLKGPMVKVYGSMKCPWTIKQLNNLPGRYEFFDCTKYQCPSFVNGYPTSVKDGKVYNGYTENL
jgi:hypothetical protein